MIGHLVATLARAHGAPFIVCHDETQHRPFGLFRVYQDGREIGRQISRPDVADCERMANPPPPRVIPPLPHKYAQPRPRTKPLQPCRRAEILADDHYGRLLAGEGLLP